MANIEHVERIKRGVHYWNEWVRSVRASHQGGGGTRHKGARIGVSSFWADFKGVDLRGFDLYQGQIGGGCSGVDLIGADLREANIEGANLAWANLVGATLSGANLKGVSLASATLSGASLSHADLSGANIAGANFLMGNLQGANLTKSNLYETYFIDTNLTNSIGLELCQFSGPCTIDHRSFLNYAPLPESFLRGCGLPNHMINVIPSLRGESLKYHSCFISYSSQDVEFAKRLYSDLQANGIRCWFAPEDLKIGDKIWDAIDGAVERHDKLLLILSESSINSEWVEDEVNKAFSVERYRNTTVLFPIRIDDSVMVRKEPWAAKLRNSRNIGNFTEYHNEDKYKVMLSKLFRDLKIRD